MQCFTCRRKKLLTQRVYIYVIFRCVSWLWKLRWFKQTWVHASIVLGVCMHLVLSLCVSSVWTNENLPPRPATRSRGKANIRDRCRWCAQFLHWCIVNSVRRVSDSKFVGDEPHRYHWIWNVMGEVLEIEVLNFFLHWEARRCVSGRSGEGEYVRLMSVIWWVVLVMRKLQGSHTRYAHTWRTHKKANEKNWSWASAVVSRVHHQWGGSNASTEGIYLSNLENPPMCIKNLSVLWKCRVCICGFSRYFHLNATEATEQQRSYILIADIRAKPQTRCDPRVERYYSLRYEREENDISHSSSSHRVETPLPLSS